MEKPPLGLKIRMKEVRGYKEFSLREMRREVRDLSEMRKDADHDCPFTTAGLADWRKERGRLPPSVSQHESQGAVHSAGWICVPLTLEDERKLRQQQEEMLDDVESGRKSFKLTFGRSSSRPASPTGGNE